MTGSVANRDSVINILGSNPSPEVFGRWAKKRGIVLHPDVAFLVPAEGMGRGAFARRPLPPGTVVVSCPFSCCISPYNNVNSVDNKIQSGHEIYLVLSEYAKVKDDEVLFVVLRLMAELCKCKPRTRSSSSSTKMSMMASAMSNTWQPWLEVCPRMPFHLFNLTCKQEEVLLIGKKEQYEWKDNVEHHESECSNTHKAIEEMERDKVQYEEMLAKQIVTSCLMSQQQQQQQKQQQEARNKKEEQVLKEEQVITVSMCWTHLSQQLRELRIRERWEAAREVIQNNPKLWPPSLVSYDLFCECMAQVLSRNFHRDEIAHREGPYLLPGLDILNHSAEFVNVLLEIHGGGRKHETSFTAVTTKPVNRGEQIFLSYGQIGSARFATEFQFVTQEVVNEDMVRFSTECIVEMCLSYYTNKQITTTTTTTTTISALERSEEELELVLQQRKSSSQHEEEQEQEEKILPASSSEYSQECLETIERELRRRIEYMQRAGILYDEGFYLHNFEELLLPQKSATSEEYSRASLLEQCSKNVLSDVRTLQIVVYLLLLCDKSMFNDTYKILNKNWEPPLQLFQSSSSSSSSSKPHSTSISLTTRVKREKLYKSQILYFIKAKWAAAHVQAFLVDEEFNNDTEESTLLEMYHIMRKKKLIHATLKSEQAILLKYLRLFNEPEEDYVMHRH